MTDETTVVADATAQQVAATATAQTTDTTAATATAAVATTAESAVAEAPKFDLSASIKAWAGDDKAKLNSLRYKSEADLFEALVNAKQRIREGNVKQPLKDDATPEEIAAYRAENGIPEKPEEYLKGLPDDLIVDDVDKPAVDSMLERLHAKNADPAVAKELVSWFLEEKAAREEAQIEANDNLRAKTEDELTTKWGANFKVNKNIISNICSQMPAELTGTESEPGPIYSATLPDGTQLMNNPAMLEWMATIGRQVHAPATPLSAGNDPGGVNIDTRIAELVRMSGDANGPYWKGMQADSLQKELIALNQKKIDLAAKAA